MKTKSSIISIAEDAYHAVMASGVEKNDIVAMAKYGYAKVAEGDFATRHANAIRFIDEQFQDRQKTIKIFNDNMLLNCTKTFVRRYAAYAFEVTGTNESFDDIIVTDKKEVQLLATVKACGIGMNYDYNMLVFHELLRRADKVAEAENIKGVFSTCFISNASSDVSQASTKAAHAVMLVNPKPLNSRETTFQQLLKDYPDTYVIDAYFGFFGKVSDYAEFVPPWQWMQWLFNHEIDWKGAILDINAHQPLQYKEWEVNEKWSNILSSYLKYVTDNLKETLAAIQSSPEGKSADKIMEEAGNTCILASGAAECAGSIFIFMSETCQGIYTPLSGQTNYINHTILAHIVSAYMSWHRRTGNIPDPSLLPRLTSTNQGIVGKDRFFLNMLIGIYAAFGKTELTLKAYKIFDALMGAGEAYGEEYKADVNFIQKIGAAADRFGDYLIETFSDWTPPKLSEIHSKFRQTLGSAEQIKKRRGRDVIESLDTIWRLCKQEDPDIEKMEDECFLQLHDEAPLILECMRDAKVNAGDKLKALNQLTAAFTKETAFTGAWKHSKDGSVWLSGNDKSRLEKLKAYLTGMSENKVIPALRKAKDESYVLFFPVCPAENLLENMLAVQAFLQKSIERIDENADNDEKSILKDIMKGVAVSPAAKERVLALFEPIQTVSRGAIIKRCEQATNNAAPSQVGAGNPFKLEAKSNLSSDVKSADDQVIRSRSPGLRVNADATE